MFTLGPLQASFTGQVTLTFNDSTFKANVSALMNITYLGDIGSAVGEITIHQIEDASGDVVDVEVWGALLLTADIGKLEDLGIFAEGTFFVRLNTTAEEKVVDLVLPGTPPTPVTLALKPESFGLLVDGSAAFRLPGSDQADPALFNMTATLAIEILEDQLSILAVGTLKLGPVGNPFLEFNAFGLLVASDQGLGARMALSLLNNTVPGITIGPTSTWFSTRRAA
jgi:hypothetical protein